MTVLSTEFFVTTVIVVGLSTGGYAHMPSDPVTRALATHCRGCDLVKVPPSRVLDTLERVHPKILAPTPPDTGEQWTFDDNAMLDISELAPAPLPGATLQYALTRIFVGLKDLFRTDLARATALTLASGEIQLVGDEAQTECPGSAGRDLDHLGESYGVGRPYGFSDCCYWYLVQLLLFTKDGAGSTWHLREVAELYTGVRPIAIETPAKVTLQWPQPDVLYLNRGFLDLQYLPGTMLSTKNGQGYYGPGTVTTPDLSAPHRTRAFLGPDTPGPTQGLTLAQAIGRIKMEGVYVEMQNLPQMGRGGCFGSVYRRTPSGAELFL